MSRKKTFNLQIFLHRRRLLVMAGVAVFFSLISLFFVLVPQTRQAWQAYGEAAAEREKLAKFRAKVQQLQQIESIDVYQSRDAINRSLPSQKPIFELLAILQRIGEDTSVSLSNVELSPGLLGEEEESTGRRRPRSSGTAERTNASASELTIQVKIEGSLNSINLFLSSLNTIAPITTLTATTISQQSNDSFSSDQTSEASAEIQLTTFFHSKTTEAALEEALPTLDQELRAVVAQVEQYKFASITDQQAITGGGSEDLFGITLQRQLQEEGITQ